MRGKNLWKPLWFLKWWLGSISAVKPLSLETTSGSLPAVEQPPSPYRPFVAPLPRPLAIPEHVKVPGIPELIAIPHLQLPFLLCPLPLWKLAASGCHPSICNGLPTPSHSSLSEPWLFSAAPEIFTSAFTNPHS